MIPREMVHFLHREFQLDWRGIHGVPHWARVRYNGLLLTRCNGANLKVVELFAFLHDARRENDGYDPCHGDRAADLARELRGRFFSLERSELQQLELACMEHSSGETRADVTVQTCWDADRLDLGRVGTRPDPDRLCTVAARDPAILVPAYARSVARRRSR